MALGIKVGTYGILRFALPLFPAAAMHPTLRMTIVGVAVAGIIYGALVAMVQPDFKKLIAYASVSHLGFVVLGIFALTVQSMQGAMMVMVSHGVSIGALFLLVGMLQDRSGTAHDRRFGGIARVTPLFAASLTIASLSTIGLPGTNGFVGEFLVLLGAYRSYPVAAVHRDDGRHPRRGLPPVGPAARDLQPARRSREPEPARPRPPRDGGAWRCSPSRSSGSASGRGRCSDAWRDRRRASSSR